MILWQRQATPQWLATNERLLQAIAGRELAVISCPGRTRSLVQVTCRRQTTAEKLMRKFGGVAWSLPHNWSMIAHSQTAHAPIRIGRRLKIVSEPKDSSKANDPPTLVIPTAGAFGTGEHATTAMSLRLLEEVTRNSAPGGHLMDAGTGTGILALAARRFGVDEVLGIDEDPRAIAHARQNARLNHIARARFVRADILCWKPDGRYDVIVGNGDCRAADFAARAPCRGLPDCLGHIAGTE